MPFFKSSRKIQTFGSSLALTLPSMFVKVNDIEKGSIAKIFYGLEGVMIVSMMDNPEEILRCVSAIIRKLEESSANKDMVEGFNDG